MDQFKKKTREIIFDKAIELFAEMGYENVSMRDIATEADIKASSIYNHYAGKEDILDSIYQFYDENMYMNRIPMDSAKKIVKTGNAQEISGIFLTSRYGTELMGKHMMLGAKIIYARMFNDKNAQALFRRQMASSIQFTRDVLQYGIDIGRIKPFDVETYAFSYVAQFVMIGLEEFTKDIYAPHESERGPAIAMAMAAALPMAE